MDTNQENREKVLDAIQSGKAKMRPKWQFGLQTALSITAGVIVMLIVIYLASFMVFALRENGAMFTPSFGAAGWYAFFTAIPWVLILLIAIFIVLLTYILRHYRLGYHWPLLYLLLAILFLIIGGSLLIMETSLSQEFFSYGMQQQIPIIGSLYSGFGVESLDNVHDGTITALTAAGFSLTDLRGRTSTVIMDTGTSLPYGDGFQVGDTVIVFGMRFSDGTIHASGVERLSPTTPSQKVPSQ